MFDYSLVPVIEQALGRFTTARIADPAAFEAVIRRYAADMEGEWPRGGWGHDHDFGSFRLAGAMGTRHVWILSRLFGQMGLPLRALSGASVLDVGCWTGGTSLALSGLGASVVAIDLKRTCVEALGYIARTFDAPVEALHLGLEDVGQLGRRFDVVFFLGVLYHLRDPLLALEQLRGVIKPDGYLALESMAVASDDEICQYAGPSSQHRRRPNVGFVPSPSTVRCWLADSGFEVLALGNGAQADQTTVEGDPIGPERVLALARPDRRVGAEPANAAREGPGPRTT